MEAPKFHAELRSTLCRFRDTLIHRNSPMRPFGQKMFFALLIFAITSRVVSAADALVEANKLYGTKNYKGAAAAFREIIATEQDGPTKAKAMFNLGLTLKQLHQYDAAISVFDELIAQPVNDKEPGGHLMEPYRNYRPRAQWEIGNCYFDQGQYKKALQAYQDTKDKHPFQSWCGNEQADAEHRYAYQAGLCHEYLGDTKAAVYDYLAAVMVDAGGLTFSPRPHQRLVEIYTRAGQLDRLNALLDDMDEQFKKKMQAEAGKTGQSLPTEFFDQYRPTSVIRRDLELQRLAKEGRRNELIKLLKIRGSVTGPPDDAGNWEAIRAAQLLAQTPEESTNDLLKAVQTGDREEVGQKERWIAFALALCGTDEGVGGIRERLRSEENSWAARSFIYSLSLAGKKGKAANAELEPAAKGNLEWAIRAYHDDDLQIEIELPKFPDINVTGKLPNSVKL